MEFSVRKLRFYILLPMLSLIVLLSACTKIDISTGIDADFTAYLSYYIELDINNVETRYHNTLKRALNEIGWYYQEELDFSVELNIEVNPYFVSMTRRIQNTSFQQAYQSLQFLLTNEDITPFMTVDMAFQTSERQNRYIIGASTDIPHIMSLSNTEELSPALQEQLEKAIETGEGTITLALPVSELVSSTHPANIQNDQVVLAVPLSFTDQTSFELTGTVNLLRDGTPGGSINDIIQEQYRLRNIIFIACIITLGLLLLTLLIVFLKRSSKREKT